jgi:hypothetical protein
MFDEGIFDPRVRLSPRARALAKEMASIGPPALPLLVRQLTSRKPSSIVFVRSPKATLYVSHHSDARLDERPIHYLHGIEWEPFTQIRFTRGDLAYFWIGQIGNRNHAVIRHETKLGYLVKAPSLSKSLRSQALRTWSGIDANGLMASLTLDALRPDRVFRDATALLPIHAFDPALYDQVATMRLRVPFNPGGGQESRDEYYRIINPATIGIIEVERLVHYLEAFPTPAVRRAAAEAAQRIRKHGTGMFAVDAAAILTRLSRRDPAQKAAGRG